MRKRSSKRKGLSPEMKIAILTLIVDVVLWLIDRLIDC